MSKDRKKPARPKDRHVKKGYQLRLHPVMRRQLERLAELQGTNLAIEIHASIRERLERFKLWPATPPPEPRGSDE